MLPLTRCPRPSYPRRVTPIDRSATTIDSTWVWPVCLPPIGYPLDDVRYRPSLLLVTRRLTRVSLLASNARPPSVRMPLLSRLVWSVLTNIDAM